MRRMPTTPEEAIEASDAIASDQLSKWGSAVRWPHERVARGDWTPVQWYDGAIAQIIATIEASNWLEPIGLRHKVGPAGQRIRDSYLKCEEGALGARRFFWSVSAKLRRAVQGSPEQWARPKPGKDRLAGRYWQRRSRFLVAVRFDTVAGRLTGLRATQPSIGSGWIPVDVKSDSIAQALAAWWNSTPVRLMLLNRRTKKLTYPNWSLAQLHEIRIPRPNRNTAWNALSAAFEQVCDIELLPMRRAAECRARQVLDEAAALALGVDPREVADWRQRLAREPTVAQERAPAPTDA